MLIDVHQIGDLIRAARIQAGLSQPQLARLADVGEAMLCRWERGKTVPTLESLRRLVDALGVPLSALVEHPPRAPQH